MAKRRLTSRQKRQRTRKIRNRVILILALLSLASAAMAPELRAYLTAKIHSGVQAFADLRTSEIDLVLPEKKIALLQLGVFDNGESAQSERARLAGLGVPCAVWQDARMRLIADAASKRETLTDAAVQGMACFIAEETLARVDVSLSAGESDAQTAAELLHLPDETLSRLEEDETLSDILADVQTRARRAVSAHRPVGGGMPAAECLVSEGSDVGIKRCGSAGLFVRCVAGRRLRSASFGVGSVGETSARAIPTRYG